MDSVHPRNIALLSIRPPYVERILNGEKTVEFRRTALPESLSVVVVYCTAPVQKVVAYFTVSEVVADAPRKLWRRFHHTSGIEKQAFFEYYDGCDEGRAIRIDEVTALHQPIPLKSIETGMTPPQCIRYLDGKVFERVKRCRLPLSA